MTRTRQPAVAGLFYPDSPDELREQVGAYLAAADVAPPPPKALIAPHAGYVYSGPVAGTAYQQIADRRDIIRRVVLLGPSHRVPLAGLALSSAHAFRTPLGEVPLDREATTRLADLPQVRVFDEAHAMEHSLEVHVPFLQSVLADFTLTPLVVGEARPEEVAEVLERLWGGEETLIVVSSDLSHYHEYREALLIDADTTRSILALRTDIDPEQACGCRPINGLMALAARKGLAVRALDVRSSGDTAGPRDRVVGYGAYALS